MTARRQLAPILVAVTGALIVVGAVLIAATRDAFIVDVYGMRGGGALVAAPFAAVGYLVARRRPENPVGWLFLVAAITMAWTVFAEGYGTYAFEERSLPGAQAITWIQKWIWVGLVACGLVYPFLLFPTGHLPSPGWRWFARLAGPAILAFGIAVGLEPGQLQSFPEGYPNPLALSSGTVETLLSITGPLMMIAVLGSIAAMAQRFRRSRGDERQQMKLLLFAGAVFALMLAANTFTGIAALENDQPMERAIAVMTLLSVGALAVGTGVGILRYRLYDIDVVISRTLTFGAMAIAATVVYVAVVVGIGGLLGRGDEPNLALSILGTATVAVAFEPLRRRVHRAADRVVYGRRASVGEVLTQLGSGVSDAYALDEMLPRLARLVVDATAAERAEVWLVVGTSLRRSASWPHEGAHAEIALPHDGVPAVPDAAHTYVVRQGDEVLGAIAVGLRGNETLSQTDDRLVADIAAHAALILRNGRLLADLRGSRQRLVAAQDTERRRIERDIHDGAQQHLVALAMKLRLASGLLASDPTAVGPLLDEIRADTTTTLEDLRTLARGIYPPLLAERGLAHALQSQGDRAVVPVIVDADGVGRYEQAVETTAYFCSLEALQNIGKYAGATKATISVREEDGGLRFSIADDGAGFDPRAVTPGAGLTNMRDRIEALGGRLAISSAPGQGTTVSGWVPAIRRGEAATA